MDSTTSRAAVNAADQMFGGGGETGRILAGIDWSQTSLGPVEDWPISLRTSVQICLSSRHPILIWWGPDFIKLYNDAYAPMLGKRHPWALGKPGREVWPEIWDIIGPPMLESVLATGQATWSDDQLLPLERNGYQEECYFTFSYSPIKDESGGVGGVFTAVLETTERVLNERRGRLVRELAAALVDAHFTDEAVVVAETARVLATDPADMPIALLYRVDAEAERATLLHVVGIAPISPACPSQIDFADALAPWPLADAVQYNATQVVTYLRWDAAEVQVEPALAPHTALVLPITEPGQATPTLLLVAGVSPRLELDATYHAWYDLLASHLATALAATHAYEAERRRAEALAEIDRAKTAFFSNVSHEFRTPLTLILAPLADSLADEAEPLPPGQRARQEVVQRNGWRLLKLVNTLLDFTRIEAGRVEASYIPTDLCGLTTDIASSFQSLIERAGLAFQVRCQALPEPVYVDHDMWEKIVLNLLSNAFKFTFEGEISLDVRAAEGAAELVVRDTGTGIPAGEASRIFERFHRVEGVRARTYEGSGIGLALVQELVHLHGGTIALSSVEGEGTVVTVRVPLGTAHLPAARIGAATSLASTTVGADVFVEEAQRWLPQVESSPLVAALPEGDAPRVVAYPNQGARVVLADDNADMRDYLARLLGKHYQVEAVATGTQALAAIHREMPALVLSDVMMPELGGFELLQALRADPATALLPVILLSARAGEEATLEGLQAGADDYLVKPFSARELLARVAARLEMARLEHEASQRMNEFLGIASHELRTPLTSIMANVQMGERLAETVQTAAMTPTVQRQATKLHGMLERTNHQLQRLDRLVGDLLDISRISAGKLELRSEPCDLLAVVRDSVEAQRATWPERRITLDLPKQATLSVVVDADRIGQVVTNYLSNALKYAPPDKPITVSVRQSDGHARVAVRDMGPGLSAAQQQQLFTLFYRVPGIEQQHGSGVGLGLGLYICKTIIERHGGTLGVRSKPGHGATFWFSLPIMAVPDSVDT